MNLHKSIKKLAHEKAQRMSKLGTTMHVVQFVFSGHWIAISDRELTLNPSKYQSGDITTYYPNLLDLSNNDWRGIGN